MTDILLEGGVEKSLQLSSWGLCVLIFAYQK